MGYNHAEFYRKKFHGSDPKLGIFARAEFERGWKFALAREEHGVLFQNFARNFAQNAVGLSEDQDFFDQFLKVVGGSTGMDEPANSWDQSVGISRNNKA